MDGQQRNGDAAEPTQLEVSGAASSRAGQATQERSVGISAFASEAASELFCVFKQRYTDFQVNEILPSGSVLHLTDIATPQSRKQQHEQLKQEKEAVEQSQPLKRSAEDIRDQQSKRQKVEVEAEIAAETTSVMQETLSEDDHKILADLFGETVTANALKLYNAVLSHPDRKPKDHATVKSEVIESKATRTQAHAAVRSIFKSKLETITLQDEPGRMSIRAAAPPSAKPQDNRSQNPGKKGKLSWDELGGEFLHFTLYKENKDTMEVLYFIASELKVAIKSFSFAGTKDRRAVTVQRVALYRVQKERLINISRLARGWKIGGFEYKKAGLELGDLTGNEFMLTLRDCQIPGLEGLPAQDQLAGAHAHVTQAAKDLNANGYINFYGLQRFGTYQSGTHMTGMKILQNDLKGAVESILAYDPALLPENVDESTRAKVPRDDIDRADAIRIWEETHNASKSRSRMPRRFQAESNIIQHLGRKADDGRVDKDWLGALQCIQRNLRLMYVHAYQSFIWNKAAVKRRELYAGKVVEGDLVVVGEKDAEPVPKEDKTDQDGELVVHPSAGEEETSTKDEFVRARPLSKDEVESGRFDIFDIVLPLPGWDAILPSNEVGKYYEELMGSDEGGHLDPHDMRRSWKDASLSGGYRRLMSRPLSELEVQTMLYTGEQQLADTDVDRLTRTDAVVADSADGAEQKIAIVLKLQLGSSQYATMALRELSRGGAIAYKPEFSVDRQRKQV